MQKQTTYTERITKNTTWATISFVVTTIANFSTSILLTRFLGTENYGIYSYFIWMTTIITLLTSLGLNQGITKYIAKYFFSENEQPKAHKSFKLFLKFQLVSIVFWIGLLLVAQAFFNNQLPFEINFKTHLFPFVIAGVAPLVLNTFFTSILSALQNFKALSKIQMLSSISNAALISFIAFTQPTLTNMVWAFMINSVLMCVWLLLEMRPLIKEETQINSSVHVHNVNLQSQNNQPPKTPSAKAKTQLPLKEMVTFSLWSYLTTVFGQIAWDRSEIFFLGLLEDKTQIAIYALAYSLAVLLVNAFAPINTVLNYTTAEVVTNNKQDTLTIIAQHGTKYLAIVMFPLVIFSSFFMPELISLVYGKDFAAAGLLFPLLVIAHTISMIASPAANVANFKNEAHRIAFITIATGILNIILDIILIPRYAAFGAAIANTLAQSFSIVLVLINARKYRLGIFNRYFKKILGINLLIAAIFMLCIIGQIPLLLKIIIATISAILYITLILKQGFNQEDLKILTHFQTVIPQKIQPIFGKILHQIQAK